MPYEIGWLIENEVMYNRNWGVGTVEDIYGAMMASREMIDSSDRPVVHLLIDNRESTESPKLIESAKVVRSVPPQERAGWVVTVHTSRAITRFLSDVAIQMTGARYRSFNSIQEALDFLRSVDDTVSWEKLPEAFKV